MPGVEKPTAADVRVAVGLFALGTFCIAAGVEEMWGDAVWHLRPASWHVLPLGLLCLLLPMRRVSPHLVLVMGTAIFIGEGLAGGSIGSLIVYLELVYAAGRHGRGWLADHLGLFLCGFIIASSCAAWLATHDLRAAFLSGLTAFAVFGTPFWWGESAKKDTDLLEAERARSRDLASMAQLREQAARSSERQALASELHDALSGNLSAITIHAEAALHEPSLSRPALELVRTTSKQAIDELQSMLSVLNPSPHAVLPSPHPLEAIRAARERGIVVEMAHEPPELATLPSSVSHALYRVLQEALANVEQHSSDRRATVTMDVAQEMTVEVISSWRPRDESPGAGHGLSLMAQRVTALGGRLTAGPRGDVWAVRASLPLDSMEST